MKLAIVSKVIYTSTSLTPMRPATIVLNDHASADIHDPPEMAF